MDRATTASADNLATARMSRPGNVDSLRSLASAVSWAAIAAGAAAAAALSLILLILGVGLGLSSVSPWARDGVGAVTFGLSTILWLTVTQLLASEPPASIKATETLGSSDSREAITQPAEPPPTMM